MPSPDTVLLYSASVCRCVSFWLNLILSPLFSILGDIFGVTLIMSCLTLFLKHQPVASLREKYRTLNPAWAVVMVLAFYVCNSKINLCVIWMLSFLPRCRKHFFFRFVLMILFKSSRDPVFPEVMLKKWSVSMRCLFQKFGKLQKKCQVSAAPRWSVARLKRAVLVL